MWKCIGYISIWTPDMPVTNRKTRQKAECQICHFKLAYHHGTASLNTAIGYLKDMTSPLWPTYKVQPKQ